MIYIFEFCLTKEKLGSFLDWGSQRKGGVVFVWIVRALKTELPVRQVGPWQERKGLIFH